MPLSRFSPDGPFAAPAADNPVKLSPMRVINNVTMEDVEKSKQTPITPELLAGAFAAVLAGANLFIEETLVPVFRGILQPADEEILYLGMFYRVMGFAKTATELKSVIHQQTLTTIDRSVIELLVDLELLHQGKIADGARKCTAFVKTQRLKAARRTVKHYASHPQFDTTPSMATSHQEFIDREEAAVEALGIALWGVNGLGKPKFPEHWSGINLLERAELLGPEMVHRVTDNYDVRNYAVHSGLAGISQLDSQAFAALCQMALKSIGDSVLAVLYLMGHRFELNKAISGYFETLKDIEESQYFVLTDLRLRVLGDTEQRFSFVADKK